MKTLVLVLIVALTTLAQDQKNGPATHHNLIDIKGTIKQVNIQMGAGMPSLDIETAKGPVKLMLGSMRYLMQNDFSPKAGETVNARAFQEETFLLAQSVELPASRKSLKLRDEDGSPLWRGGPMHKEGQMQKQGPMHKQGAKP